MSTETKTVAAYRPTAGVYALLDPRTNAVMYVGQALNLDYRFRQHLDPMAYDSNIAKKRWVNELRSLGLVPRLVLLAECSYPESDRIEREEIKRLKSLGQCEHNRASGGRSSRGTPKLSGSCPEDWFAVGRELRQIRDSIMELTRHVGQLGGPKLSSYVLEACRPLEAAALRIDMKLAETYPGWTAFSDAFYRELPSRDDG